MNILITGANGLIGSNLIGFLQKKHTVNAIVRESTKLKFNLTKNVNIIKMDLSKIEFNYLPKNVDAICYLAQSKKFRDFPAGSEDVFCINVQVAIQLVNFAIKNRVKKFIYLSSGGVYSNLNNQNSFFKEDCIINANQNLGFYISSKLSAEILLRNYAKFFETFAIVRPFFVYGPGQDKTMLIPRLISNIKNNLEITLSGEEGIKINPLYVTDASRAIEKILDLKGEYIFNIAGNEVVSIKKLCLKIEKILGIKPIFKQLDQPQNDLIGDNTLMKTLLHNPKISLQEGLMEVIKDDFND